MAKIPCKANREGKGMAQELHGVVQIKGEGEFVHEQAAKLAILGRPSTGLLEVY
jgi:hypothetical protein